MPRYTFGTLTLIPTSALFIFIVCFTNRAKAQFLRVINLTIFVELDAVLTPITWNQ